MSKEYLEAFETVYNNIDYLISDIVIEDDEVNGCLMTIKEQLPIIKQALLKAQEQEKEKLFFKNIHNTKVKTPLVSIFEGLSKDERFKITEHIYYHWEEMKEALEEKNNELEKENAELKAKEQKEHSVLEIIKEKYPDVVEVKLCNNYEHYKLRMSSKHDTEIVKIDWNDRSLLDYLLLLTEEEFYLLKEVLK